MIAIVNISESKGLFYGEGTQIYKLMINKGKILEFDHRFSDGLSVCLSKVAAAVEEQEAADTLRVFK